MCLRKSFFQNEDKTQASLPHMIDVNGVSQQTVAQTEFFLPWVQGSVWYIVQGQIVLYTAAPPTLTHIHTQSYTHTTHTHTHTTHGSCTAFLSPCSHHPPQMLSSSAGIYAPPLPKFPSLEPSPPLPVILCVAYGGA